MTPVNRLQILVFGLIIFTIGFTVFHLAILFPKRALNIPGPRPPTTKLKTPAATGGENDKNRSANCPESGGAVPHLGDCLALSGFGSTTRTVGRVPNDPISRQAATELKTPADAASGSENNRSPQAADLGLMFAVPSSTSRTCQAKRHIMFLKTHKTAGSTILNLLHRYGDRNGLNFALPFRHQFKYPDLFHSRSVKGFNASTRQQYDILCHHMRFHLPEVQKVMPSDSFYFTIIRDPAKMAESAFSYYRFRSSAFRKARQFKAFVSNPSRYYHQKDKSNQFARNLLSFDLGYNPDAPFTEALAKAQVQEVERTFNLVLLTENFDESMILLKEELCWELDDVVTFKLNMRGASVLLEQRDVERLRAWNALDWYLYSHFNRTFWEKVERFGKVKMENEVRRLRERRQQLAEFCLERLEPVIAEDIKEELLKPYQAGQEKILGWAVRKNLPPYVRTGCVKMVTPELQYMELLDARQFPVRHKMRQPLQLFLQGP